MPNGDLIDRVVALGRVAAAQAPGISYTGSPYTWYDQITSVNLAVTNAGGPVTSYAVQSGTLPAGVSLNTSSGAITGTPTALKTAANVVIRATGPGGVSDATINVAVVASLLTSLVGYWELDEASGTRNDSGPNALHLTDNNTVGSGLGVDGVSTAADFVAVNTEYLSRADEAALDFGDEDQYICAWINMPSIGAEEAILSKNYDEYELLVQADGQLVFYVGDGAGSWKRQSGSSVSAATWTFIEAKYTASTDVVAVSKNGGAWVDGSNVGAASRASGSSALNIGRRTSGSKETNALVQGVGVWRRIPTDAERTWLYNTATAARTYAEVSAYTG